jgi:hypothetical protein
MESNRVFLTFQAAVTDGFRLEAIDYLLKPSVAEQVTEAANRLLSYLRLLGSGSSSSSGDRANEVSTPDKMLFTSSNGDPLPVNELDRDPLLARRRTGKSLRLISLAGDPQIAIMRFWWPKVGANLGRNRARSFRTR